MHIYAYYIHPWKEGNKARKRGLVTNEGRFGLLRNVVLNTTQHYICHGHTCNLCTNLVPHKLSF